MKLKKIMVVGLIVIWAMVSLVGCGQKSSDVSQQEQQNQSLMVYSGAGLRKPMDEIGNTFKKKFGVEINYTYAGSAQNVVQIELTEEGDAYIPGARHYIEVCQEKGLVKSMKTVAYHIPVIGVPKGNPAQITGLSDLTKSGVKVILGDERACAIGKVAQKLLERNNLIKAVEKNIVTKDATVNEIVVHTAMEQGDACIVWEDNIANVDEIEIVTIPKEENMIKTIPIGALTCSKKPELAQKFVDFVASDEGKTIFEKYGFKPVE